MLSSTLRMPYRGEETAMEFILILLADREAPEDPSIYPEMGRFAGELAGSGKLRGGAPLHPEADGARLTGDVLTLGPFPGRGGIGGYFLIACKNRAGGHGIANTVPAPPAGPREGGR